MIKAPPEKIFPYVAKIVHVLFDMDKMVGRDFEAGLASLKSITEK